MLFENHSLPVGSGENFLVVDWMSFSMSIFTNRLKFFAYLLLVRGMFLLGIRVSFSKSIFLQMFSA
jgi:hypothetical protein